MIFRRQQSPSCSGGRSPKNESKDNNKNFDIFQLLEMKNIVFKLNMIKDDVSNYEHLIFHRSSNFVSRRQIINKHILKLLKNELDIIKDTLILIQVLDDFLVN